MSSVVSFLERQLLVRDDLATGFRHNRRSRSTESVRIDQMVVERDTVPAGGAAQGMATRQRPLATPQVFVVDVDPQFVVSKPRLESLGTR